LIAKKIPTRELHNKLCARFVPLANILLEKAVLRVLRVVREDLVLVAINAPLVIIVLLMILI
jgi:hypothetical protein